MMPARRNPRRAFLARHALAVAATVALGLSSQGCSEKPPAQNLIWAATQGLPTRRASLTAVVATSKDRVLALGFDRPEGLIANIPLALIRVGSTWTYVVLPSPAIGGSVLILAATAAADGSIWSVGRVADFEPEPSRITPVVYRYAGGVWNEVPIVGAGDLNGVELRGVAAVGSGAAMELRAVGSVGNGQSGIALRYSGGVWSRDSLPPPAAGATGWWLSTVGRARDGKWFAAGGWSNGSGGTVFVDGGAGWAPRSGALGFTGIQFTTLGFDAGGTLWLGGNFSDGDSLVGALFHDGSGSLQPVSIARKTTGIFQIYGLSFDAEGHGWVAGGRSGYQPFLAGSSGGPWTEAIAKVENEAPGSAEVPGGGDLFGVSVLGEETAIAVGYKVALDPKGLLESELSIYELIVRPVGEIDLVVGSGPPRMHGKRD